MAFTCIYMILKLVHSSWIYFHYIYNVRFDLTFIKERTMHLHVYDLSEFIAQLFTIIALITCISGWER